MFDGHGGQEAAKYAASKKGLVSTFIKVLQEDGYSAGGANAKDILQEALRKAFLKVDEEMREVFNGNPNERSGCTAVAVLITPQLIVTANAGDSRALLCSGGENVPLSEDHKPFLEAEKARIEAAGGCVSMKRVDGELAVSRSLGDFQYKDNPNLSPEEFKVTANPDVKIYDRTADDEFVVLACDGIWDVMDNDEVIKEVKEYCALGEHNPKYMCEELLMQCLEKQSRDNMSAIITLLPAGKALVAEGDGLTPRFERRAAEAAEEAAKAAEDASGK